MIEMYCIDNDISVYPPINLGYEMNFIGKFWIARPVEDVIFYSLTCVITEKVKNG